MKDYRSETFIQFIKTHKPGWILKIIWGSAAFLLLILFIVTYKSSHRIFWQCFIFIILMLLIQASFAYTVSYRMYSYGRKAYEVIKNQNPQILKDVNIFIRGFDLFSKESFFSIDISKPVYQFDRADVIIGDENIILLGASKEFGSISYASPVEIFITEKQTGIAAAKLLNWTVQNERIVIEINDEFYRSPFKIEFKDNLEILKHWLTAHLEADCFQSA